MALKMNYSEEDLRRAFEKWHQRIIDNIAESLLYVCAEAVNRARATDTYKDRTNNLRSSIGFVIYYNGQRLFQDFKKSGSGTGGGGTVSFTTKEGKEVAFNAAAPGDTSGQQGQSQGAALADKVSSKYSSGFVAVIVAGMNYALYVEAKGFDVITGNTLDIGRELGELMRTISATHGLSFGAQNQNDNT